MKSGGRPETDSAYSPIYASAQVPQAPEFRVARFEETAICQSEKPGGLEATRDILIFVPLTGSQTDAYAETVVTQTLKSIQGKDFETCYRAQYLRLAPNAAAALRAMEDRNRPKLADAAAQAERAAKAYERLRPEECGIEHGPRL